MKNTIMLKPTTNLTYAIKTILSQNYILQLYISAHNLTTSTCASTELLHSEYVTHTMMSDNLQFL